MPAKPFIALAMVFAFTLTACERLQLVTAEDVSSTPTVYAKEVNAPNPLLLGHWRRPQPSGISRPWAFHYWLLRKGDRYAVYYGYESHKANDFKGWADFTIDGDSMVSGVDGVVFFVKDGQVWMKYPGRDEVYYMQKLD